MIIGSSAPSVFSTVFKKNRYQKIGAFAESSRFFLSFSRGKYGIPFGNDIFGNLTKNPVTFCYRARAPPVSEI